MRWNPSLGSDDLGDNLSGTKINKAYLEALRDSLNLLLHSETYPTVSVKDIINQVRQAAGNLADVNTRIGNVVDADGNPIVGASVLSTVKFQGSMGLMNLAKNPSLLLWDEKTANAPPTYFAFAGTGASCVRTGTSESDTNKWIGTKAAKLTDAGSGDTYLRQTTLDAAVMSNALNALKNRYCTITAAVKTNTSSLARMLIGDGATSTPGSYHTGSNAWEVIYATHKISTAATQLYFQCQLDKAGDAYVDGFCFTFTEFPPTYWLPPPAIIQGALYLPFPGVIPTGDGQGTYTFSKPVLIKSIQGGAGVALDNTPVAPSGGPITIDVEKYETGPAWASIFTGAKTLIADGASHGGITPDGDHDHRCFTGKTGGDPTNAYIRLNIDATNSAEGYWVAIRCNQYLNPLEDFLAYDDL